MNDILEDIDDSLFEEKEIKTYEEKGRGKKECPKCKLIIGVRNKICICGHAFIKKADLPPPEDKDKQPTVDFLNSKGIYGFKRVVYIPRGECPVKHKKDQDIVQWATNLIGFCESKGDGLALSAILYWLGTIYHPHTKKCKLFKKRLKEWYAE